jgi:hypothetical protein
VIQNVRIKKGSVISKNNISSILSSARSTFQYAKFTISNSIYITVNFNKDFTVTIATNSRNLQFYREMQITARTYSQIRIAELLYRWMPKLNF